MASLNWAAYKRQIVAELVDLLAADQHKYFEMLLDLLLAVSDIEDPAHLKVLEDGKKKYDEAVDALNTLRKQTERYRALRSEQEEATRRRETEKARAENAQTMTEKLQQLNSTFKSLQTQDEQKRGYALETLLTDLFALYDVDTKGSFRIYGEQLDGAFTFENGEYLFEAKWRKALTPLADLDTFNMKVQRKLDNTLGLFFSMNGFQPSALGLGGSGRPRVLLMDGYDLTLVLEDRVSFPEALRRKRQHAARTGEIFLRVAEML
ncbi:hypothetical protein [Actinokineospora spheciospongiae]|uniref:hypothetical protein n=1 Tax=Actinokineospora spheciospongiae TaxID=909613 RepID=UPI0011B70A77|nr:hypothetical protein [Actinokineospora spheciospongiae]